MNDAMNVPGPSRRWLRVARLLLWGSLFVQALLAVWVSRPWASGDSPVYLGLARSLSEGCYGNLHSGVCQPDALRPPGYPLILLAQIYGLHLSIAAIVLFQAALYLCSLRLLELIMIRLGISVLPLLAVAAIYPFGLMYCTVIMAEAWATLGLTAIAFLMCREEPSPSSIFASGLIAGLLALARADLLFVGLFVAGLALFLNWSKGKRRAVGHAFLTLLASAAVLLPYAIWNFEHFHKFSAGPADSAGVGNSLYLATWQEQLSNRDLESFFKPKRTQALIASGFLEEVAKVNAAVGAPPDANPFNPRDDQDERTRVAASDAFGKAAINRIKAHPLLYVRHLLANVWLLWNTSIYPPAVPRIGRVILTAISGLVYVAGLLGLILAFRRNDWRRFLPAAAFLLYLPAVHIWLHTEARYTAAARPLLLMFAAVLVNFTLSARKMRRLSPETANANA